MSLHWEQFDGVREKNIPLTDVFDGRLEKFGIRVSARHDGPGPALGCLMDKDRNSLWCHTDAKGNLVSVGHYEDTQGAPDYIMQCLSTEFGISTGEQFIITQCASRSFVRIPNTSDRCLSALRHPVVDFTPPAGWLYTETTGDQAPLLVCPDHAERWEHENG